MPYWHPYTVAHGHCTMDEDCSTAQKHNHNFLISLCSPHLEGGTLENLDPYLNQGC